MEPIKTLGEHRPGPLLTGCLAAWPGQQGRAPPGRPRSLMYFGDLEKRGIHLNLCVLQAKSDGRSLVWLLSLEEIQLRLFMESSSKTDLVAPIW